MKRIFGILLAALLVLPTVTSAFAVEKSAGLTEEMIINTVGALEIMQGDENGNLNLENNVTRAEFVKMAVSASNYKDDADVKIAFSVFPDVQSSHWAAGFIRTAVGAGWINGYLDGTFRPSGIVKLEEAVTITLKLLGYTDADFIGSYPDGQMAKYRSLSLDNGIDAKVGDTLTRRECMYLIYNALCTYTKSGQSYAATLGHTADKYGNIDYSALMETEKEGPYIVKDISAWKNDISAKDGFTYYKNGKVVDEKTVSLYDVLYCSPTFKSVWIYEDKTAGIIEGFYPDKKSPSSVTVSGVAYQLPDRSDYSGALSSGEFSVDDSVVLLLGENGVCVEAYSASAPVVEKTVNDTVNTLYINDVCSDSKALEDTSLIYYCDALSSAFAYDKNVSGIVSALSPTKQDPSAIVMNGKTYSLSGNVKELFKNESTYGENDFLTVYFGKNGQIEFVSNADIYDTDIYKDNGLTYESLVAQTLKGPEIVLGDSWKQKIGFDADSAEYFTDGKKVSADIIKNYDVIYYSPAFKSVWIYSDKVTGILEGVSPNTVAPSAVTVGGSSYTLETAQAIISFGGKGSFVQGDTVTLLMGAAGVVAAVEPSVASAEFLGLSTAVEKTEYTVDGKTYSDHYVTVSSFDGRTHKIKTDDADFEIGRLVMVRYTNGEMNVKSFSVEYKNIDDLNSAIKNGKITPDAVLVDYYYKSFVTTYPARLKEISLKPKNVAYYSINSEGDLDYLVLKDATGDCHTYGVVFRHNGKYSFLTSSKNSGVSNYLTPPIGAVQVKYNGTTAQDIALLSEITVSSVDSGTVKYIGSTYKLSDKAECFVLEQKKYSAGSSDTKSNSYESRSISELISQVSLDRIKTILDGNDYTVKGYCDPTGTVRVLVAQKNF